MGHVKPACIEVFACCTTAALFSLRSLQCPQGVVFHAARQVMFRKAMLQLLYAVAYSLSHLHKQTNADPSCPEARRVNRFLF